MNEITEEMITEEMITEEMITEAMSTDTPPAIEEETVTEVTVPEADTEMQKTEEDAPTEDISAEDPVDTLLASHELRAELDRLRAELEQTKALHARMAEEIGEFHAIFPEIHPSALPESVWEQVKNGVPLAASYALYEKKCILAREHAEKINLRNAQKTPGAAGKNTPSEYFSPDEVRAMSQSEVRANYQKIRESMKKWNS